jgi:hypothetical protein
MIEGGTSRGDREAGMALPGRSAAEIARPLRFGYLHGATQPGSDFAMTSTAAGAPRGLRLRLEALRQRLRLEPVAVSGADLAVIAVASALLALIPFAIFHPGLWTSDSTGRWANAYRLVHAPSLGKFRMWDWFPPAMCLLMALTLKLTGTVTVFTYLQYWFVELSGMIAALALSGRRSAAIAIGGLVGLCPGVLDNAALVMPDPWTAGALAIAGAALGLAPAGGLGTRFAFRALLLLASIVLFGFRANTVVVLPFLVAAAILGMPDRRDRNWLLLLLLAGLGIDFALAHLPIISHIDLAAVVLLWEIACTLKVIGDPATTAQFAVPGLGDMAAIVSAAKYELADFLYWREGHPVTPKDALDHAAAIRQTWTALVASHPAAYLEAKSRIWYWLAEGFNHADRPFAYITSEQTKIDELNRMLGIAPEPQPEHGLGAAGREVAWLSGRWPDWLYIPWCVELAGLTALAATAILGGRARMALLLWLFGTAYYASFFILSPGFQSRYLFPTGYLTEILIVAALARLLQIAARAPTGGRLAQPG